MSGPLDMDDCNNENCKAQRRQDDHQVRELNGLIAQERSLRASADDELYQLRQALAAVEKLHQNSHRTGINICTHCYKSWPCPTAAALGAAGSQGQSGENPKDTPTPQDDEDETLDDELRGLAGTWVNDPHLDRNTAIQCANDMGSVLDRYSPVTSTPEAATETTGPHEHAWCCSTCDAGPWDGKPLALPNPQ